VCDDRQTIGQFPSPHLLKGNLFLGLYNARLLIFVFGFKDLICKLPIKIIKDLIRLLLSNSNY